MAKKPSLALIDAHALIHRAYHALPMMMTRGGQPTGAVYGFTTMLLKMVTSLKPTHVVAAFDRAEPTFRKEKFAAYKAHREKAPAELISQFDWVRQVVKAFNIPILEKAGFEADDVIGTVVEKYPKLKKVIVTGDMDALQLVDEQTTVFALKRGLTDTVLYTRAVVEEKFEFGSERLVEYKGLRGDPSDNIPGVKGIGEKTAQELIKTWGTIEEIYRHLEKVSPRARTCLTGQQAMAELSRELATIRRDVPLQFELGQAVWEEFDRQEVEQVFRELEFLSLLPKIPKAAAMSKSGGEQGGLFGEAERQVREWPKNYYLAESKKDQQALLRKLKQQPLLALDTENEDLGARQYPIVGMSFAYREKKSEELRAYYLPVDRESVKIWQELLEDEGIKKVGHNLKYDAEVLAQSGIKLKGIVFDSMLASYLLQAGLRQHNLDGLAATELNFTTIPITELIGTGKKQKKITEVPLKELAHYAAEDAEVAYRLYESLGQKIKETGLSRVLGELELPLIEVLAEMELSGVKLDTVVLEKLKKRVSKRLIELEEKIWQTAGGKFNINSTQQLREILFGRLNLSTVGIARTQTGFSTAAAELNKLRGQHEIIKWLEEYRELAKLKNTYLEALPKLVDKNTGRIYAQFNQTVAATGRLSSSNPNLQNIPVRTELGQAIRGAFVAPAGHKLVKADYSQIELRLTAHMAQDEKMLAAFRAGQDIHAATAAWVYGIAPEEVSSKQRREAKTLNFGVLYGMGASSFARAAEISKEEAVSFLERYREQYQGVTRLIEETVLFAREHGYVETLLGRRREVPEINSRAPQMRAQAERVAFNFPLQGTAADILKKAMIEVYRLIKDRFPEVKLILTVHDELVAEVPEELAAEWGWAMKQAMEGVFTLDVPLIVDVAAGPNWQAMAELTF
jgi:DNA polymerase-1